MWTEQKDLNDPSEKAGLAPMLGLALGLASPRLAGLGPALVKSQLQLHHLSHGAHKTCAASVPFFVVGT